MCIIVVFFGTDGPYLFGGSESELGLVHLSPSWKPLCHAWDDPSRWFEQPFFETFHTGTF